ncbi:MAG: hypothetical protein CR997_04485 [Acidobacteria bacterium]|nr:MAG: hypothetical protein CR997_04485 [Acidobacteriota bacterium]
MAKMKASCTGEMEETKRKRIDSRKEVIKRVQLNKGFSKYIIGNVDLSHANLRGGNFMFAVFDGTNLKGADFKGSNFLGADLSKANLRDVSLYSCNLYKAKLPKELPPQEILLSVQEGTRLRYCAALSVQRKMLKLLEKSLEKQG